MNTAPLLNKNCSTEFNRDTAYWNEYYKKNTPESMPESNFASFVKKYLKSGKTLVDLGCGNGRDSLYFSKLGVNVIGIDASDTSIAKLNSLKIKNASFICGNFISCPLIYAKKVEYFYSRFSIHAIDEKGEDEILANIFNALIPEGKLFVEVRGIHDPKFGQGENIGPNSYILDGHYRRFIVMEEFLSKLIKNGFHIKYAEEEKNFAPYNDENPQIIRIVAEKEHP